MFLKALQKYRIHEKDREKNKNKKIKKEMVRIRAMVHIFLRSRPVISTNSVSYLLEKVNTYKQDMMVNSKKINSQSKFNNAI